MIFLDAARMAERGEAHAYLKEAMGFPEYYGKNLDALYDCLTELPETRVRFVNLEGAQENYFAKVLRTFQEAAEENENLILSYDV